MMEPVRRLVAFLIKTVVCKIFCNVTGSALLAHPSSVGRRSFADVPVNYLAILKIVVGNL